MEKEKNTKTLMILMIICVCLSIVTLGLVIYDRFIRKEPEHAVLKPITIDNQKDDKTNENNNEKNNQIEKDVYKTKDNKFTLKIIDLNSEGNYNNIRKTLYTEVYNNVKEQCQDNPENDDAFGEGEGTYKVSCQKFDTLFDSYFKDNYEKDISNYKYGYLNNHIIRFDNVYEDELYGNFYGSFLEDKYGGQYGPSFLVNKKNGQIIEHGDFKLESWMNKDEEFRFRFTAENDAFGFIKTNAGYFFVHTPAYAPADTIYTTSWKELGYVEDYQNIKSDKDGIYVYKNSDLNGSPIKYNDQGSIIK